jgi:hypothetical protein
MMRRASWVDITKGMEMSEWLEYKQETVQMGTAIGPKKSKGFKLCGQAIHEVSQQGCNRRDSIYDSLLHLFGGHSLHA